MKLSKLSMCATAVGAALGLAAAGAAHADPIFAPSMTAPLSANAMPASFDAGPFGKLSVGGAVSGLGMYQNNHVPGDHQWQADFSNAQAWVAKTDGPVQFFVEVGGYSFPSLGTPYFPAKTQTDLAFGVMPVGYIKIVPNSHFSIIAGKLPTLIGSEYGFTFQNMNINRGLLWNQEPLISRGVQANFSQGPIALSVAFTDGFYSNRYNQLSGLLTFTVNASNSIAFAGGGNLGSTPKVGFATPLVLDNSSVYNLFFSHTSGPLTISPYLQYTHVSENPGLGIVHSASTWGGAILGKYSFTPEFAIAARGEYIKSSGTAASGAPSLLYGNESKAWSLTVTPTYQKGIYFVRGEAAYTKIIDGTPGAMLGGFFNDDSQFRLAAEAGVIF